MRDAWVVVLAVVVVFVLLVAIEVGRRSSWRSPVDLTANLFTRPNVRNTAPPAPTSSPDASMTMTSGGAADVDLAS